MSGTAPRIALCTEGFHPGFNKMAPKGSHMDVFRRSAGIAAELGYRGIEVVATTLSDAPLAMGQSETFKFRDAAKAEGVEIIGLHWLLAGMEGAYLTNPDDAVRSHTVDTIERLMRLTDDIGGKLVVHGSPKQRDILDGVSYPKAFATAVDVYQRVMNRASSVDVAVCFEQLSTSDTTFLTTLPELNDLITAVGRPRFTGHLDIKALYPEAQSEVEAADLIRQYAGIANHLHLNDWTNMSGPGTGDLDMEPIYRALGESGYYSKPGSVIPKRWMSVEIFDFLGDGVPVNRITNIARNSIGNILAYRNLWEGSSL